MAVAIVVFAVAGGTQPAHADQRRGFDRTFANGRGWVTTALPGWTAQGKAMAVQDDGRIVVAGQAFDATGRSQIVVARYLADGRLDRRFGRRGVFRSSFPAKHGPFLATGVAVQPRTGKLVVGGGYGQDSMLVLRLTRRGAIDRDFGARGRGYRVTKVGGVAEALTVAADGKILLGGSDGDRNGRPMVVARYLRDGRIDRRFGRRGVVRLMFWDAGEAASAGVIGLSVAPGGRITGSGHLDYIGGDGHGSVGVFRLTGSGRPVRSFGQAGAAEVAFRSGSGRLEFWFPCAMVVDERGRTTVTGDGTAGLGNGILTMRLRNSGVLDRSFGSGDGRKVVKGVTGGNETTCGAAPTPGNGLTVGVEDRLLQLRGDGGRDRTFGRDGLRRIRQPRGVGIEAVATDAAGRILIAGGTAKRLYLARLMPRRR